MTEFRIKRIYDSASDTDGYRVLVDRLWPRGVSKEKAALDEWAKELAPSDKLRKWFNHDEAKFTEFKKRYKAELKTNSELESTVKNWRTHTKVTLLYGAHDEQDNQAIVLKEYIETNTK